LDLLDVLGYGINFDTDMHENSEFKNEIIYSYKPERGFYPQIMAMDLKPMRFFQ